METVYTLETSNIFIRLLLMFKPSKRSILNWYWVEGTDSVKVHVYRYKRAFGNRYVIHNDWIAVKKNVWSDFNRSLE